MLVLYVFISDLGWLNGQNVLYLFPLLFSEEGSRRVQENCIGAGRSPPSRDKHPVSRARPGTRWASFVHTFALLQWEGFALIRREKSCSSASFSKLFAFIKQRALTSAVVETRAEVKDGNTGKAGMK